MDEIYGYLESLQNEKLWMDAGKRSPYWPVGSTRIVQNRVNIKAMHESGEIQCIDEHNEPESLINGDDCHKTYADLEGTEKSTAIMNCL